MHFIVLGKSLEHHSLNDIEAGRDEDKALLGHMMVVAAQVA